MLSDDIEMDFEKPSTKRVAEMIQMRNLHRFTRRIYFTFLIIFLLAGAGLLFLIFNSDYQKTMLLHQSATFFGIFFYFIVLLFMCVCSTEEMKIVTLILISFCSGSLFGFIFSLQVVQISEK